MVAGRRLAAVVVLLRAGLWCWYGWVVQPACLPSWAEIDPHTAGFWSGCGAGNGSSGGEHVSEAGNGQGVHSSHLCSLLSAMSSTPFGFLLWPDSFSGRRNPQGRADALMQELAAGGRRFEDGRVLVLADRESALGVGRRHWRKPCRAFGRPDDGDA
uniref:Uncharacterized protein n=1 Tax=Leersia perrieri TaxID=77586 RepID=A0A0D9XPY8_9ORYZ